VQWAGLTKSLNDSPDFGLIYLRGLQSFEEMDPLSKIRFGAYRLRFFKQFEADVLSTSRWHVGAVIVGCLGPSAAKVV